jgi:ribosomal protein L12E/L44/L45/RPP1/RPP2
MEDASDFTKDFTKTKRTVLEAIINSLSESTNKYMLEEFEKLLSNKDIKSNPGKLMPYIYAATLLSLTGREIDQENLSKVLLVIGVNLDKNVLEILAKANVRSHIPYLDAYYFLIASGKLGTEQEILDVIKALGLTPDKTRIIDILSFLNKPQTKE